MKVYALTYKIGISSGSSLKLIGIFESEAKAEEIAEKYMEEYYCGRHHFSIKEIELNKEMHYVIAEW